MDDEKLKTLAGSAGWAFIAAIAGGILTGGLGALAGLIGGALSGGNQRKICVAIELKDGRKFLGVTDTKTYHELVSLTYKKEAVSLEGDMSSFTHQDFKIFISKKCHLPGGVQKDSLPLEQICNYLVNFLFINEYIVAVFNGLDKLKAPDWKKVSIALAIATGRRMAEIHLTSSQFEYVDKTTCNFTGQLKVKGDAFEYFEKNPAYPIPVLVNAQLVCDAHEWLKRNSKTVEDTRVAANRYTKDLSEVMKLLKNRFGIEHDFFTYKGLRTIYAQVCSQVFNNNDPDNTLYLARILGHGRGELRNCLLI